MRKQEEGAPCGVVASTTIIDSGRHSRDAKSRPLDWDDDDNHSGTSRETTLSLLHASTGVGGAASSSFTFFSSPFFDQSGFFCKIEDTSREIQTEFVRLVKRFISLDSHT